MHRHPHDLVHSRPRSHPHHAPPPRLEPRSKPSMQETRKQPSADNDGNPVSKPVSVSQAESRPADLPRHARHDSHYHYAPPSPVSDRARQSRHYLPKSHSSWPPQPYVEDELVSLRRESGAYKLLQNVGQEEAPSRGTVDQEPLIIDVPQLLAKHERRYVLSDQVPFNIGIPTPPTSEDERARKARRKPSKLGVNDQERIVPDVSKRSASPYTFIKPSKLHKDFSSSDRYSSLDTLTPLSASSTNTKAARFAPESKPKSPRHESMRGGDYLGAKDSHDDCAIDDSVHEDRPVHTPGKSMTEKALTESPRVSAVDSGSLAANAPPIRKLNLDARRNTDTQNTLPTLGRLNIEKSRRPTPLMASSSLSEARDVSPLPSTSLDLPSVNRYPHARSRESSYASSRGPSPVGSVRNGMTPPSRSPRMSTEFSQDGSTHGSRPPSATNSRPATPSPRTPLESPRLARCDLDWAALLTANAARRAKTPSRVVDSFQHDTPTDTVKRRNPSERTSQSSNLPYPEDSSLMGGSIGMPEEQHHLYYPVSNMTPASSEVYEVNSPVASVSPAPSTSSRSSARSTTNRPLLIRGYSASTFSPSEPRSAASRSSRSSELKRTESFATTSDAKRELGVLMKKRLPACSRPEPVSGYDDWYTVSGATNIDVCPECILFFERTIFRSHFRRSLPRDLNAKVRCAFGSPWVRLAWVLTLQQHRTDLSLLKDLAEIEATTDPCPGAVETTQSWYGLRDPDGLYVRDFYVCFGDIRKIERLLPTLAGMFVKLPQRASHEKQTCAIRTESNRFSAYLDAVISTHERAVTARKAADPMPLIELVEHKTRLRECIRDNMLIGGLWHFIPDVPYLTVCEDCFESVVEPEIKKGSSVAKKFNRTVQPVYGEGLGSSCQLYSWRMRKVFQRAVEDSDLKYLSRKSKERREMELWLQDRYKDVMRKAKRLSYEEGSVSGEDERRLTRDLEKISNEWKTKWE